MQFKSILSAAVFAMLFAGSPRAVAVTTTMTTSGDWHTAGNWDNGVPQQDDKAVIPSGKAATITTGNAVADNLELGGTLSISTHKLTLDGDDVSATHVIKDAGVLTLANSGAKIEFSERNHSITTDEDGGAILGSNNGAVIDDDDDSRQLTIANGIKIHGRLVVDVELINNGTVDADNNVVGSILSFTNNASNGSGVYKVSQPNSTLHFAVGTYTALDADFSVANGILLVDVDVATSGDLVLFSGDGALIKMASGKYFSINQP